VASTAQALNDIRNELKNTTETVRQSSASVQQNINTREEARAAAREASEVGKAVMEMTREIKNKGLQNQTNGAATHATVAARGPILAGTHNTQVSERHLCRRNVRSS